MEREYGPRFAGVCGETTLFVSVDVDVRVGETESSVDSRDGFRAEAVPVAVLELAIELGAPGVCVILTLRVILGGADCGGGGGVPGPVMDMAETGVVTEATVDATGDGV